MIAKVIGGLAVGLILRTFVPYLIAGFNAVSETEDFAAWPAFLPSYLVSVGVAILGYGIAALTVPGTLAYLASRSFVELVGAAYLGQALSREGLKLTSAVWSIIRRS